MKLAERMKFYNTPGVSLAGKSNKVLSVKTVNEMLTPQVGGWGLGLELRGKGDAARFGHGGSNEGFQCLMVAYRNTGQGAVVMTNADRGGELAEEIMQSIAKEYGWPDYLPKEKVIASIDPKIFDAYVGEYQLASNFIITVTNEGGHLMGEATGQGKFELFPESERDFFLKVIDAQITFIKDAPQGRVTGLVPHQGGRDLPAQKIK
jgi:hypothetical protein